MPQGEGNYTVAVIMGSSDIIIFSNLRCYLDSKPIPVVKTEKILSTGCLTKCRTLLESMVTGIILMKKDHINICPILNSFRNNYDSCYCNLDTCEQ